MDVLDQMRKTIAERNLAAADAPVLLMVSGGSDSTALAYLASELSRAGELGALAMLHVNHCLRGDASDGDARFVATLAETLSIPLFSCEIDVAAAAEREGGNVEAVARRERYLAANEALESLCRHVSAPVSAGRIFTAHTADDRVENFYMRSIVGTGPGGFRSMLYRNGSVARPLLGVGRDDLRDYLRFRADSGAQVVRDGEGRLWREDATNAHTDRFRAYVRHEIVPRAKERNPRLLQTLSRTMDLIADEDDMLQDMADDLQVRFVSVPGEGAGAAIAEGSSCALAPELGRHPVPLVRRVVAGVLQALLGVDARVEAAAVDAVVGAWNLVGTREAVPRGGYVVNIQGNLAVSANKRGVRIEPMASFRARRKR